VTAVTAGRPTRRELLLSGAAGGLLLPAAVASAATTADAQPFSVTDRLARLIRLELLLVFCYRHVLASSILTARARRTLAPFVAHEEAHASVLEQRLRARGGAVPAGPTGVAEANHDLAHRKIGGRLGQLKGDPDALRLLLTLEQVTVGAYFVALTKLQDAELITLVCQIMANDAQHESVIGLLMPKSTLGSGAPYGLVQGLQ
jgi:hypothetical protein